MSTTKLFTPKSNNIEFEQIPAGVYLARCYKMIDLGTQTDTGQFGTTTARKILVFWELLQDEAGKDIRMQDGRPFSINKMYTWSMNKKANLRKDLEAWRGEPFTDAEADGFEITKLLDKYATLQVVHKSSANGEKTYANVGTLMRTTKQAPGVNKTEVFAIDDPDMEMMGNMPDWIQDKIRAAGEWSMNEDAAWLSDDNAEKEAKPNQVEKTVGLSKEEADAIPF